MAHKGAPVRNVYGCLHFFKNEMLKYFQILLLHTMKLLEHYNTRQMEGTTIGRSAKIIRFKDCPLHCAFCDTKITMLQPEIDVPIEEIKENLLPDIIFSGGEPGLHKYQKEIVSFLSEFPHKYFDSITIETNGLISPTTPLIKALRTYAKQYLFSVSPKFGHINEETLAHLVAQPSQFKFVIEDDSQIQEIKKILPFCNRPIILQPCYSADDTLEEYLNKVRSLIAAAPSNYLVIPQLQHILYGNQAGI